MIDWLTFGSTAVCKLNFCGYFCEAKPQKGDLQTVERKRGALERRCNRLLWVKRKDYLNTKKPFPCTRLNDCCRCWQQTVLLATRNAECVFKKTSNSTGTTLRTLKRTAKLKIEFPEISEALR
ncbi:MAG TPA: hypothetical protein VF433_02170 [Cellvibrio sp.]